MCANCGFPAAPGHWTEAGATMASDRMQARRRRVQLLRNVLHPYGLTADDDGVTPGISVSTMTGNQEIARDISDVWVVAERLIGKPVDPFAPFFLAEADKEG